MFLPFRSKFLQAQDTFSELGGLVDFSTRWYVTIGQI